MRLKNILVRLDTVFYVCFIEQFAALVAHILSVPPAIL